MEKTVFENFLDSFDEAAWSNAVQTLLPEIHAVDRAAVQIWFGFYPLELFRVLQTVEDKGELARKLGLQGDYELVNQIDSSHRFLYGHRYWRIVKDQIAARAVTKETPADLPAEIRQIAKLAATKARSQQSLITGITAIGMMTLVQVGLEKFKSAVGATKVDPRFAKKTPDEIVAERAKDTGQGLLGFLKTVDKKFTVTWDEQAANAKFRVTDDEEIATAAQRDQSQNWQAKDARCFEGVIPVECRSAACGTCWVGVLGGAEKLSNVTAREQKSMRRFGYLFSDEPQPLLRLACQAKAHGAVTIVIPPWNGVYGKQLYRDKITEEQLQPATTSARANREVVKDAAKNQLL